MGETVPTRDVEPTPAPEPTEAKPERAFWRDKFGVKQETVIDEIERVKIVAGVNEYKGNYLVFIAKETSPHFARQFFSMPAYVWQKAVGILNGYTQSIAEIEKKAMAEAVIVELKRLKELGIDIKALAETI